MLNQIISVIGALLVLSAYAGNLGHLLNRDGAWYAGLNAIGSGLLSYVALYSGQAGLILIEVAWTLISLIALVRALRRRRDPAGEAASVAVSGPGES